jgi:hypothetical protein
MVAFRISKALDFSCLPLSSRSYSCGYYFVLPLVMGSFCATWDGVVLAMTVPWPLRLILSWIAPEFHNHKGPNSLMGTIGPTLQMVAMQAQTQLYTTCLSLGSGADLELHLRGLAANSCGAQGWGLGGRNSPLATMAEADVNCT